VSVVAGPAAVLEDEGRLMTLNDTGRYFFPELPHQFVQTVVEGKDIWP